MKRAIMIMCTFAIYSILTACSVQTLSKDKVKDLEFTIVTEEIPEELAEMIAAQKGVCFKLTYTDRGKLYIAEGYGKQETSGYSIEVKECFESSNAIYFHTNLLGPSKAEQIRKEPTYPYIVIQMDYSEKHVVFM